MRSFRVIHSRRHDESVRRHRIEASCPVAAVTKIKDACDDDLMIVLPEPPGTVTMYRVAMYRAVPL